MSSALEELEKGRRKKRRNDERTMAPLKSLEAARLKSVVTLFPFDSRQTMLIPKFVPRNYAAYKHGYKTHTRSKGTRYEYKNMNMKMNRDKA